MTYLAADYFQDAGRFADALFSLFGPQSALAARLAGLGTCRLRFAKTNTRFNLPRAALQLAPDDEFCQASYWHNYLFNLGLGRDAEVLVFRPDWASAAVRRDAP